MNGTRPRDGFMPTSPQHAAGTRMEPPPSDAWATGTIPAATSAAEPPDDPPVTWPVSQGLRVIPNRFVSVTSRRPNSDVVLVAIGMKPADL